MILCGYCLQVLREIREQDINIYNFPDCDSDEDEDFKQQDSELKVIDIR